MSEARAFHPVATKRCPKTAKDGFHACPNAIPRGEPVKRSQTPVKKRRSTPRRQVGTCPELRAWTRLQPCFFSGKTVGVVAAHLPRTKRLGGDLNNLLPLHTLLHRVQHNKGVETFAAMAGHTVESLGVLARAYTDRFLAELAAAVPRSGATP